MFTNWIGSINPCAICAIKYFAIMLINHIDNEHLHIFEICITYACSYRRNAGIVLHFFGWPIIQSDPFWFCFIQSGTHNVSAKTTLW